MLSVCYSGPPGKLQKMVTYPITDSRVYRSQNRFHNSEGLPARRHIPLPSIITVHGEIALSYNGLAHITGPYIPSVYTYVTPLARLHPRRLQLWLRSIYCPEKLLMSKKVLMSPHVLAVLH